MTTLFRSILCLAFVLFLTFISDAQSVGINQLNPDPSTKLDIAGVTQVKFNSSTGVPHLWLKEDGNDFTRLYFSNNTPDMRWSIGAKLESDTTSSTLNFFLSGAGDVLRLRGNKRVGINANPTDGLHIKVDDGENAMRVQIDGLTKLRVYSNGGTSLGANNESGTEANGLYVSGNTGLGVNNPTEKLEVDGAIVLGVDNAPKAGAIRYVNDDFEGFNGTKWVSLTKSQAGEWGEVPSNEMAERQFLPRPDFGENVKLSEVDIDGDYVIAGSTTSRHNGMTNAGSAHIYHRDEFGKWNLQANIVASDASSFSGFGNKVRVSGDVVVISNLNNPRKIYVFRRSGTTWSEEAIIQPSDYENGDSFGSDISIDGDFIAASSPFDDVPGNTNAGSIYIFKFDGTGWNQEAKIILSNSENLGLQLSLYNNKLANHSRFLNGNGGFDGKISFFERVGTSWILAEEINETPFVASVKLRADSLLVGSIGSANFYSFDGTDWSLNHQFSNATSNNSGEYTDFSGNFVLLGYNDAMDGNFVNLYDINNSESNLIGRLIPSTVINHVSYYGRYQAIDGNSIVVCAPGIFNPEKLGLYFYSRE